MLPTIAGMTNTYYTSLFLVEMRVLLTLCSGYPEIAVLPISTSQLAMITGMSYRHPIYEMFFD
jgi:hypothetical protein